MQRRRKRRNRKRKRRRRNWNWKRRRRRQRKTAEELEAAAEELEAEARAAAAAAKETEKEAAQDPLEVAEAEEEAAQEAEAAEETEKEAAKDPMEEAEAEEAEDVDDYANKAEETAEEAAMRRKKLLTVVSPKSEKQTRAAVGEAATDYMDIHAQTEYQNKEAQQTLFLLSRKLMPPVHTGWNGMPSVHFVRPIIGSIEWDKFGIEGQEFRINAIREFIKENGADFEATADDPVMYDLVMRQLQCHSCRCRRCNKFAFTCDGCIKVYTLRLSAEQAKVMKALKMIGRKWKIPANRMDEFSACMLRRAVSDKRIISITDRGALQNILREQARRSTLPVIPYDNAYATLVEEFIKSARLVSENNGKLVYIHKKDRKVLALCEWNSHSQRELIMTAWASKFCDGAYSVELDVYGSYMTTKIDEKS
ncbi:hypothetical protein MPSEU_001036700 [Mayamaea pseudoterrestris]|nr:hypothetical protein MPSEU_001036700 [Mayamaea pseudoterrestris]